MRFLLSLLFYSLTLAQVKIYSPEGKILNFPNDYTLYQIEKKFEPLARVSGYSYKCGEITAIYYKLFTREPLFIVTDKTECITSGLKSFNFVKYMSGPIVEIDIKIFMEKKLLTDLYILNTLGHPDNSVKDVTGDKTSEIWYYNDYNLAFKFINGYVIGFMRF